MTGRSRWAALAFVGLGIAVQPPAASADEASYETYRAINDLFTAGADASVYMDGSYPALIAPHIRGSWAQLQLRETVADAETLDRFVAGQCENAPTFVNPVAPLRVVIQRTSANAERTVAYDYAYIVGASFAPRVDPMELASFFGFDRPGMEQMAANAMSGAQQQAEIYAVDDAMFVVVRQTDLTFFMRCPGDDGVGNRDLAIEDALWRTIDGLPDMFDADMRNAYLDCGRKVLTPTSRAELAALVAAIDAGGDTAERFGEEHPDIAEGLAGCFATAERDAAQ